MTIDKLTSIVCRLFFGVAFLLLAVAVLEKIVNICGYTIMDQAYKPSQLLGLATCLMVFVAALMLRQVKEGLKK